MKVNNTPTYLYLTVFPFISCFAGACEIAPGIETCPAISAWGVNTKVWWIYTVQAVVSILTVACVVIQFICTRMSIARIRITLVDI